MEIVFFFKSKYDPGISINHVMKPIVETIGKSENIYIKQYYLPAIGLNIKSIISNLLFVHKNRSKKGINHIVGEVHYAVYALLGCKSVLTVHDIGFWTSDKFKTIKRFGLYFTHLYPIKLAKRVVAISNFTKTELCKELPSIRDKISVIPSGSIDGFEYYHKTFDKSNFIVLQNGVRPHKNLETTIQALQGISCKLLVVRKMDESQIQLANRLNIKFENVYDLSPEEVKETYRRSDIVCFPSSYEGFGVITIEAQAIGRPVITTNKEPMKSVAGDAALYINNPKDPAQLHDAIIKLINDDKLRENLIKKGVENSRQYRLGSIASKYIDIFSSIEK